MEWANILSGAFVGLAGAVVFADLVLLFVLRRSYLFWHALRVVAIAFIALAALPLGAKVLGGFDLFLVQGVSLDLTLGLIGPLILSSVERGTYSRAWRCALRALLPATLAVALLLPFFDRYTALDDIHDLLLGGGLLVVMAALAHGVRRHSVVSKYFSIAFAPGFAVGTLALVHELAVGGAMPYFYELIFAALTFELVIFALGLTARLGLRSDKGRSEAARERDIVVDPATGFVDRASLELMFTAAEREPSCVAIIGLDGIDLVGKQLGREAHQAALETIADAFRSKSLVVAHVSHSEFAVVAYGPEAELLVEKVRTRCQASLRDLLHGSDIRVTATAGISRIGSDTQLFSIFRRADRALQRATDAGGGWTLVVDRDGREVERVEKPGPAHLRAA